jgi:hypothetical protein
VSVPDQIAKPNPAQKSIGSLAELHLWQVEQLDGVLGKWPAGIQVPGADGNTVSLNLNNVSQAVTEQIGMLTSMAVTLAQTFNAATRGMVQAGSATQQAHMAHMIAKANAEFLGYDQAIRASEMPLSYTPGLNPLEGLFNESKRQIQGFENRDTTDLKHILAELLQAAAIIRAVFWRKIDPKQDFEQQIRDNVESKSEFLDSEQFRNGLSNSDWEEYLRQVENGFVEYRNIRESNGVPQAGEEAPYNRGPESRPKIKDISDGDTSKQSSIDRKRKGK